MKAVLCAAFLAIGWLASSGCSSGVDGSAPQVVRFTAIPDSNTTELAAKFRPLASALSEALGVTFEYVPVASYDASVEAFKHGDIQLAWFGGLTGVQARAAVPGASAIAQGAIDPNFKSYFIAHESTGLELSDSFPLELAGKTFTFGSSRSTSGRLMPEHFIRMNTGQSPAEFFGQAPGFSGAHDKTAELVSSGAFQTGVLSYAKYDQLVADGKLDPKQCRIVWVTPEYSDYNWTLHPVTEAWYGPDFGERVRAALLELDDPELLKACLRERFIKAENADFDAILKLAKELEFVRG